MELTTGVFKRLSGQFGGFESIFFARAEKFPPRKVNSGINNSNGIQKLVIIKPGELFADCLQTIATNWEAILFSPVS